jgi:hypothetical protein
MRALLIARPISKVSRSVDHLAFEDNDGSGVSPADITPPHFLQARTGVGNYFGTISGPHAFIDVKFGK